MKWYYITDLDLSVSINHGEVDYTREHLGWKESEVLGIVEQMQEDAEKALEDLSFVTNTNDVEEVIEEALRILRDVHDVDTDCLEFEASYGEPFSAELLKVDEDGTLHLENQCDHCGELVDGTMHVNDYLAGKKPICPKCGKPYTPCNECMWDEDCSVCPFKKHN